jgi:predicted permease
MRFDRGIRVLWRVRWLWLGVTAMVGLGIGLLTSTIAVVNAALFRPPPFVEANRIALLYMVRNPVGESTRRERWSWGRIQLLRASQHSFETVANYSPSSLTISGPDDAELLRGEFVSPQYLSLFRIVPERGRLFVEDEYDPGRPAAVAVISRDLWQRRWNLDPAVIGQTIRLNGENLTVIGVVPAGFHGLSGSAEIWIPATMAPRLTYADYVRTNQNFISVVGRLRPGVSLEAAQSELAVLGAAINRALPSDEEQPAERASATAGSLNEARTDRATRRSLFVLCGAVSLLHLLALANVSNLLLGRAIARRRETAVRAALGGSSARLFRSLLGENLLLALPGALLGVVVAWWVTGHVVPPTNVLASRNFYGSVAPFDAPRFGTVESLLGLAAAVLSALLVAIPPALSAFRLQPGLTLRSASQGLSSGAMAIRRPTLRGAIVALEAMLAVLLVVSAGLLLESFRNMRRTDLGIDPANVLTFWLIPSEARVQPRDAAGYVGRVLEALRRVPGVVAASVDGGAPLAGSASTVLYVAGRPVPPSYQAPPVRRHYVAPDHFRTLGIPLVRGRGFTENDGPGAPPVTVISETAARRFWPDENPIGKRVWFGGSAFTTPDSAVEIVGVVGDVVYDPLDRNPSRASFYTAYMQFTYASRMVFLKTAGNPLGVVAEARRAIRSVDPDVAMRDVLTLEEVVNGSWARTRFEAVLFGSFGLAALLLAASGIFAVLAWAVANRTREFGVRIALGADTPRVMRLVLREGLAFPVAGILLGLVLSVGATRILRSSLYEVTPTQPRVYLFTIGLLLAAAMAACLLPAWRAARADPMEAMRAD